VMPSFVSMPRDPVQLSLRKGTFDVAAVPHDRVNERDRILLLGS
jgi:hypothetical protein